MKDQIAIFAADVEASEGVEDVIAEIGVVLAVCEGRQKIHPPPIVKGAKENVSGSVTRGE